MANIQSKKKAVVKKGAGFFYDPNTFEEEKDPRFFDTDNAQDVLDLITPFEYKPGHKIICFDTETSWYYPSSHDVPPGIVRRWVGSGKKAVPQDYPFCISVSDGNYAITLYDSIENDFAEFKKLAPLFEDASIEKTAHNTKFDMHMFANAGLRINGLLHDTVTMQKLVDENLKAYTMLSIAERFYWGVTKFEYMVDSYKSINKIADYRHIPRELLTQYANADVMNGINAAVELLKEIETKDLQGIYHMECEDMIVLYAMEREGILVDEAKEFPMKAELQKLVEESEAAIYEYAGRMFNINSSRQLLAVLEETGVDMSLLTKRTASGNISVDKDVMAMLETKGIEIAKRIAEFKKNEKVLNTYINGIYEQRDSQFYVHGSINQTEARTGRMSITKPALQTLHKKDKRTRSIITKPKDYTMWLMDLDQIEYRLFAHYARIPNLIKAIDEGYDVHAATAAQLNDIALDEFMKLLEAENKEAAQMRADGKTANFAILYGVGVAHFAEIMNLTEDKARQYKARYLASMPEIKIFINTVHQVIQQRGFIRNFYGRRRSLPSSEAFKAPNSLIQGCAADYIKTKMIEIYKYIRYNNLLTSLRLIVHDELMLYSKIGEEEHLPRIRWILSEFEQFRCNITAGAECSTTDWSEKSDASDIGFEEPEDKGYLNIDLFDGHVFDIGKVG